MRDEISTFEKFLAGAAFVTAAVLALAALNISKDHDIAAGVLMACAQFLVFAASILHIDYKLGIYDRFGKRNSAGTSQQQPA